jgi:hypothetical protein
MRRFVAVVFLATVLLSCGGGRSHHHSAPQLRYSGFQTISSNQEYLEALKTLGEHCYQGGMSLSATVRAPSFRRSLDLSYGFIPVSIQLAGRAPGDQTASKRKQRKIHSLEQLAYLDDIEVAQYRANKAELVIIGPPSHAYDGIRPDDFLAVFRAVAAGSSPGVSIDPGSDTRTMKVRYFGQVEQTQLGISLFEADRTLKVMSTGFDNLNCSRWTGMPPGVVAELELFSNDYRLRGKEALGQAQWHRFWLEFNDSPVEREDAKMAIRIPKSRLRVNEQSIPAGYPSPGSAQEFAATLTNRFLDLSALIPSFKDVQRSAALTSLAKWIVDLQIPADRDWIASTPAFAATPESTPRITVVNGMLNGALLARLGIEGGVDFQKPNKYASDNSAISTILGAAERAFKPKETMWDFTYEGRQYRAIRLPYQSRVALQKRSALWYWTSPTDIKSPHLQEFKIPTSTLSVTNKTQAPLSIGISGTRQASVNVASGGDQSILLLPGSYSVSANSKCGTLNDSLSAEPGTNYTATYYCEQVPEYTPPPPPKPHKEPTYREPRRGNLTIENGTGVMLSVQVSGPESRSFSASPGTSSIALLPGNYSISVSSTCGGRVDNANISSGGTSVETYTCQQVP